MTAMLNPQPLPPRVEPTAVVGTAAAVPEIVSPVAPRTCPTCTSGVFRLWGSSVLEWSVPVAS